MFLSVIILISERKTLCHLPSYLALMFSVFGFDEIRHILQTALT